MPISGPILREKANYFYTKLHPGEQQTFFFDMNIKKKLNQQYFSIYKKYIHWHLESEVQIWNKQYWQRLIVKNDLILHIQTINFCYKHCLQCCVIRCNNSWILINLNYL